MREKTTLELFEDMNYRSLETAETSTDVGNALTELGFTHLAMGPDRYRQARAEIWAGAHGRTLLQNLGSAARVAGHLYAGHRDQLTIEHLTATYQDRHSEAV